MNPYRAAGELAGIASFADAFYSNMDTFPEVRVIRNMHPEDLTEPRKKLTYFLCGVLGGRGLYIEHYGGVNLPEFHKQFPIGTGERDAWMLVCNVPLLFSPLRHHLKSIYWLDCGFQRRESGWSMRLESNSYLERDAFSATPFGTHFKWKT